MALQTTNEGLISRRKENLRRLCDQRFGGNRAELARVAGIHANQINFALSDNEAIARPMGENFARRIENNLSLPTGYLDRLPRSHDAVEIVAPEIEPKMMAVLATSSAVCTLGVTQSWISQHHITAPERLRIAEVSCDGMDPELKMGEQVILEWLTDDKDKPIKPDAGSIRDGIYILDTKIGPVMRRVKRNEDATFVLISNGQLSEPRTNLKELSFFARVITPLKFGS